MTKLAAAAAALRRRFAVLRRPAFLRGEGAAGGRKDVTWLRPDGAEMQLADWQEPAHAVLAFRLEGAEPILVVMNGEPAPVTFRLPEAALGAAWRVLLDTGESPRTGALFAAASDVELAGGALVAFGP
jgi:glycogen operon protein